MKKENEMKKMNKSITVLLSIMMAATMTLTACGQIDKKAEEETVEETEAASVDEVKEPLAEEDLDGLLTGVEDHYVLQDAKDVDYMHGVTYDETVNLEEGESTSEISAKAEKNTRIIYSVNADNSKVDDAVPGTYMVTYTVKVNRPAYDTYMNQEMPDKSEDDSEDVTDNEKIGDIVIEDTEDTFIDVLEEDLEDVIIEKNIEVVDQDKARELAEAGESVWADGNRDYGEILEEEKKAEESKNDNKETTNTETKDEEKTENTGTMNEVKDSNMGTSEDSGKSGSASNSSSSKADKHTHNYTGTVTKAATCGSSGTKTYKCSCGASYTESIPATGNHSWKTTYTTKQVWVQDSEGFTELKCQRCGYTTTDHIAIIDHAEICGGSWSTRYHEATGHYETEKVASGSKCSVCGATK